MTIRVLAVIVLLIVAALAAGSATTTPAAAGEYPGGQQQYAADVRQILESGAGQYVKDSDGKLVFQWVNESSHLAYSNEIASRQQEIGDGI